MNVSRLWARVVMTSLETEHQRQVGTNVTVRNIITSMRLVSALDWAKIFESSSLVDAALRSESAFAEMDFPTRNRYRHAIEETGPRIGALGARCRAACDCSREAIGP